MRENEIKYFLTYKQENTESIEKFKLSKMGKIGKGKILDFSHSFEGKLLLIYFSQVFRFYV
jgi:hypothetical protein